MTIMPVPMLQVLYHLARQPLEATQISKPPNMYQAPLTHTILTVLASAAYVAAGTARVVNNCGTQLYIASVKNNNGAKMQPLPVGGYSEPIVAANNGVSIKVAASPSGPVVQFEYTLAANGQLSYDTSNIDGNPFAQYGTRLAPSQGKSAAFPTCVVVDCPPGAYCDAAYNLPDDVRTKVCPGAVDLVFTVCSGKKMSGASNGGANGGAAAGAAAGAAGVAAPAATTSKAATATAAGGALNSAKMSASPAASSSSGRGGSRGHRFNA